MLAPSAFLTALLVAVAPSPFPRGHVTPLCGARTIPYQQQALVSAGGALWVACRDARQVARIDPATGATTRRAALGAFRPWALAAGAGALWAIDRDRAELWRLDPRTGRRVGRIALASTPASVWFGAGAVWVGFDGLGYARVDARTGRVATTFSGDGVSAFATDGRHVFVVSHRDNAIARVDPKTGRSSTLASRLADPATGATEQAAFAGGALWVTGRGLDLLRIDPGTGRVTRTIEIGPAGLGVATVGSRLVVTAYSQRGARRGDPLAGTVSVVDPRTGAVTGTTTATGNAYVSGLFVRGRTAVVADTVLGRLVRFPLPG